MANSSLSLTSLFVLVLCAHFAITLGARPPHIHPHKGNKFIKTKGTKFVLHGSPYLFNGFNSYWMMSVAVDPAERHKVTEVFRDAALAGMTVCRTWAFADGGGPALQLSPGVYDEKVFQVITHDSYSYGNVVYG